MELYTQNHQIQKNLKVLEEHETFDQIKDSIHFDFSKMFFSLLGKLGVPRSQKKSKGILLIRFVTTSFTIQILEETV